MRVSRVCGTKKLFGVAQRCQQQKSSGVTKPEHNFLAKRYFEEASTMKSATVLLVSMLLVCLGVQARVPDAESQRRDLTISRLLKHVEESVARTSNHTELNKKEREDSTGDDTKKTKKGGAKVSADDSEKESKKTIPDDTAKKSSAQTVSAEESKSSINISGWLSWLVGAVVVIVVGLLGYKAWKRRDYQEVPTSMNV